MIIIRLESGLGNQMLDYLEYLAVKKYHSEQEIYIDTTIYDVSQKMDLPISMWNGFELEKIFGVSIKTLKDLLGKKYEGLIDRFTEDSLWTKEWIYAPIICDYLDECGYKIENLCYFGTNGIYRKKHTKSYYINFLREKNRFTNAIYRFLIKMFYRVKSSGELFYLKKHDNFYCGHTLNFMKRGYGIELIESDINNAFNWDKVKINIENKEIAQKFLSENSVAIHARRGDFLSTNGYCYKYGYFKRAVKFIKKHVSDPSFIFFTDEKSVNWIHENLKIFNLSDKDKIEFVDWNRGEDSYQDIYLMSKCKHNIITQSSFGWWGTWFNNNPNKITIAPDPRINVTNWF